MSAETEGVGAPTPSVSRWPTESEQDLYTNWSEEVCTASTTLGFREWIAARLQRQVDEAGDIMLAVDNGGTWGSFTCTEIEALADVFRAAGREDVAGFIISEHAESDEDDDLHTKDES